MPKSKPSEEKNFQKRLEENAMIHFGRKVEPKGITAKIKPPISPNVLNPAPK